jgi:hypothetical protein
LHQTLEVEFATHVEIIKMFSQTESWGLDLKILHGLLVPLSAYLSSASARLAVTLFFYFQSDYYKTPINDIPFHGTSKPIPPSPAARMQWILDSTKFLIDGYMKVWSPQPFDRFWRSENFGG